jgi:CelD/BcsL family acetyltransferase involved in cellulose biosynthesis
VKEILLALKSGNTDEAASICDNLDEGVHQSFQAVEPLGKLRVLALWIQRSPQRRQAWNNNCKHMDLSDKFIEYDVDTRWNSTFRMLGDALKVSYLSIYMSNIKLMLSSQSNSLRSLSTMRLTFLPLAADRACGDTVMSHDIVLPR